MAHAIDVVLDAADRAPRQRGDHRVANARVEELFA
jgi:hypothetical protein